MKTHAFGKLIRVRRLALSCGNGIFMSPENTRIQLISSDLISKKLLNVAAALGWNHSLRDPFLNRLWRDPAATSCIGHASKSLGKRSLTSGEAHGLSNACLINVGHGCNAIVNYNYRLQQKTRIYNLNLQCNLQRLFVISREWKI